MKTASLFMFFFCVSVAAIVMKEGAIDAARVLKQRNIVTSQADKNPCDHQYNFLNGDYDVRDILKSKLPCGPKSRSWSQIRRFLGLLKMKASNAGNPLKINKLPSGPSGGVGHKYMNAAGYMKPSGVAAQTLISATPLNKLPSGSSGGVGHSYND